MRGILVFFMFLFGFAVNSQVMLKDEISKQYSDRSVLKNIQKRTKPKIVTILWDTSRSMENRALDKELKFLDAYFEELKNVTVHYQPYSNRLGITKIFEVNEGQWANLKKELESCIYDGGGTQSLWKEMMISDHTLLFTDGKYFPENLGKDWNGEVFTVNGNRNANHKLLKELAEDHRGNYLNLEKMANSNMAMDFIRFYRKDNLDYNANLDLQKHFLIKGNVGDLQEPLSNVTVQVRNTDRKTTSDNNGDFSIKVFDGEVLDFSYPGRENASSIVQRGSKMLKIIMPVGLTVLDEVVIEENHKSTERSPTNKDISTRWGKIDMERIGFGAKQLDGSEINPASQTIMDAIEGKFSGVEVVRKYPEDYEMVALRDGKYTGFFASWDIDGMIYPPDRPPLHINVQNVRDITIMPAGWAGARYGFMGRGGVIIVRTISATFDDSESARKDKGPKNRYKNDAVELTSPIHSKPIFVQRIAQAESVNKAYRQYILERKAYGGLPSFYLETSKIFGDYWKDTTISRQIMSNLMELFPEDISALKILAYSYEEENMLEEAASIYRHIYRLKQNLQAKRDLAKAHVKLENYKEAWKYYKDYISRKGSLNDKGLDRLVKKEMLVFIQNFGDEIGIDKSKFDGEKLSNLSLVVEWNDSNAQFELQFVSPSRPLF
ncbi:tetratricopeptide repeat protein [Flagellimonas onchidii]|uniref:tetratricopeptide repeat protein n=1 Tax=Flagellimonas onchidii TaxID=2562684 RepID=UPI0010A616C3|nr:carboxypeptidase-like regulatory domain-containing protein [Allomuricauda onchidii]